MLKAVGLVLVSKMVIDEKITVFIGVGDEDDRVKNVAF